MSEFKRIIQFDPAFDKRNSDPNKDYGIGAMMVRFVLVGDKGATHFVMSSGWYLKHNREDLQRKSRSRFLLEPMAFDWGYHSPTPVYEGQIARESCGFLDGKPCYGDGTALYAVDQMEKFFENGLEWLWKELENSYNDKFGGKDNA